MRRISHDRLSMGRPRGVFGGPVGVRTDLIRDVRREGLRCHMRPVGARPLGYAFEYIGRCSKARRVHGPLWHRRRTAASRRDTGRPGLPCERASRGDPNRRCRAAESDRRFSSCCPARRRPVPGSTPPRRKSSTPGAGPAFRVPLRGQLPRDACRRSSRAGAVGMEEERDCERSSFHAPVHQRRPSDLNVLASSNASRCAALLTPTVKPYPQARAICSFGLKLGELILIGNLAHVRHVRVEVVNLDFPQHPRSGLQRVELLAVDEHIPAGKGVPRNSVGAGVGCASLPPR